MMFSGFACWSSCHSYNGTPVFFDKLELSDLTTFAKEGAPVVHSNSAISAERQVARRFALMLETIALFKAVDPLSMKYCFFRS
jgi:hypothetical protein